MANFDLQGTKRGTATPCPASDVWSDYCANLASVLPGRREKRQHSGRFGCTAAIDARDRQPVHVKSNIMRSARVQRSMDAAFELGLYTFGDLMPETQAGKAVGAQQRVAEILAAAK